MLAQASRAQQGPPRSGARPGLILRPTFIPAQNWAPPRRALDYTWGFTSPPASFTAKRPGPCGPEPHTPSQGLALRPTQSFPCHPRVGRDS